MDKTRAREMRPIKVQKVRKKAWLLLFPTTPLNVTALPLFSEICGRGEGGRDRGWEVKMQKYIG